MKSISPFSFAFLLLRIRFGIMRDFAGQGWASAGNETVTLLNPRVPVSCGFNMQFCMKVCPYFRKDKIYHHFRLPEVSEIR